MDIFVDSSFDEKQGIAGIGLYIKNGVKERCISNWMHTDNNNYSEMFGVYLACILMNGKEGTIYTDSQTAIMYINDQIRDKPRTKEQYFRHQRMRLLAYKIRKLGCNIQKTKAHEHAYQKNAMGNNIADLLAKNGRTKFYER
jgi:ribonuclease HI